MRTYTAYRNAGRTKIYDDAMLWILFGFLAYPLEALELQIWALRYKYPLRDSFAAWATVWEHQMEVWDSL